MQKPVDIRSVVSKLVGAHSVNLTNSGFVLDEETGVKVYRVKVRKRSRKDSLSSFLDALNAAGVQYAKVSGEEDSLELVYTLYPKGDKNKMSKLKEKMKGSTTSGESTGKQGPSFPMPSGGAPLVTADVASELFSAGYIEEAVELIRVAGEGSWDGFRDSVSSMLSAEGIHKSPEAKYLTERVSSALLRELGDSSESLRDLRTSDLADKVKECLCDNLDFIVDTRQIAESLIRRSYFATTTANLSKVLDGYLELREKAPKGFSAHSRLAGLIEDTKKELVKVASGGKANLRISSGLPCLILKGQMAKARVMLLSL